jgi:hypothetical protein
MDIDDLRYVVRQRKSRPRPRWVSGYLISGKLPPEGTQPVKERLLTGAFSPFAHSQIANDTEEFEPLREDSGLFLNFSKLSGTE